MHLNASQTYLHTSEVSFGLIRTAFGVLRVEIDAANPTMLRMGVKT